MPARGRWTPKRVVATPAAYDHPHGHRIMALVEAEGIEVERLSGNRLTGLRAETDHETYARAKSIIAVEDWRKQYGELLSDLAAAVGDVPGLDLTTELITHRFTPGSKEVLLDWYPRTRLEMDEAARSRKQGKFGAVKYVYPAATMTELKSWFYRELAERLPCCRVLYWT
jgi:spore photoproduct lyase